MENTSEPVNPLDSSRLLKSADQTVAPTSKRKWRTRRLIFVYFTASGLLLFGYRALDDLAREYSNRLLTIFIEQMTGAYAAGRAFFLRVESIRWIEAAKNYVHLRTAKDVYRLRGTIEGLQQRLDPAKFIRVNRSQIVNLDNVKELHPWFHGEYRIILNDGTEINWSRRYIDRESNLLVGRV